MKVGLTVAWMVGMWAAARVAKMVEMMVEMMVVPTVVRMAVMKVASLVGLMVD